MPKKTPSPTIAVIIALSAIIIFSSLLIAPLGAAEEQTKDTWLQKAALPTPRAGPGLAVVDGKIYAIGGDNNGAVNTNEMYDPTTNTWTTKAPMPNPRAFPGTVVYQNKIYCIGGQVANSTTHLWEYLTTADVYDPATDTWENKTALPTPRSRVQPCVANGKIYVIGGEVNQSLNYAYDPAADSWAIKAPIPQVVTDGINKTSVFAATGVVDNRIYWIGATLWNGTWSTNVANLMFNPENDSWSTRAAPPLEFTPNIGIATTGEYAAKRVYVLGYYNKQCAYDPVTDQWTNCSPVPKGRSGPGITTLNDTICVIGGLHTFGIADEFYQYIPPDYMTQTATPTPTANTQQSSQTSQTTTKTTPQPTAKPTLTPEPTATATPAEKLQSGKKTATEQNLPTETIALIVAALAISGFVTALLVWKQKNDKA